VSNGGEISGSARHGINGGSESDGLDNVSTVIPSDKGQSRGVSSQRNSTSRILSHIGSTESSIAIRVDSRAGVDVDVPEHAAFLHLGGGQRTLSSGDTILHQHRAVIGGRGIGGESQVLSLGESAAEIGAHPVKEGGLQPQGSLESNRGEGVDVGNLFEVKIIVRRVSRIGEGDNFFSGIPKDKSSTCSKIQNHGSMNLLVLFNFFSSRK